MWCRAEGVAVVAELIGLSACSSGMAMKRFKGTCLAT